MEVSRSVRSDCTGLAVAEHTLCDERRFVGAE